MAIGAVIVALSIGETIDGEPVPVWLSASAGAALGILGVVTTLTIAYVDRKRPAEESGNLSGTLAK